MPVLAASCRLASSSRCLPPRRGTRRHEQYCITHYYYRTMLLRGRELRTIRQGYPKLAGVVPSKEEAMMDRERPSASESEGKIPEAWIGQEVMIETTEALSRAICVPRPPSTLRT